MTTKRKSEIQELLSAAARERRAHDELARSHAELLAALREITELSPHDYLSKAHKIARAAIAKAEDK